MSERKTLTITQVKEIERFGADNQGQKLVFRAKEGNAESEYITFKRNLFDKIKVGETINADVETSTKEWGGQPHTEHRITQIYVEGQPVAVKRGYQGKSPEELEQQGRVMVLSYAKDLCVSDKIPISEMLSWAELFWKWLKKNEAIVAAVEKPESKVPETKLETEIEGTKDTIPTGKKVQNIPDLKKLLMDHKIPTHEAYRVLSIKSFMDLVDLDEAWKQIKEAKGIK
jgi:hypothetical protein